ncbi:MAG: DotU family type IV/VI secretion system protein [Candidatus Paracaedimonas acanthamoebae]|uniref:DotU family type IV/VI secretion system protein n=1 Tax=Candidatus Paracaedimonas acanthamoebae TaxID=244581 RepID=A0A8J7PMN6_9PROT|nr:DotU family type IV/VI secretion system protein [Candidatus Paracaedimonas acanthamoebae]
MGVPINLRRQEDYETSFVIRYFEEFYTKIIEIKERIKTEQWLPIRDGIDDIPGDQNETIATQARGFLEELRLLIERQTMESSRFGGEFAVSYYLETKYIMAALADEIFLSLDWKGRKYWEDNLLESFFFETHDAGEQFFTRLENLLATRDPLRNDLAQIYLLSLGLGFQGKYRDTNDEGQLTHYLRQLYVFINHSEPKLYQEEERLFPEAYTHTPEPRKVKLLQDVRLWMIVIASAFATLLLASYGVWHSVTSETFKIVDRILYESGKKQ